MPEYKIEERFVSDFEKKVKKLVALCEKYDLNFTFKDLGSSFEWHIDRYVKYHTYLIEDPVDNTGWRLLARINHTDNGNIVERVSSEDIPRSYYYGPGKCDHCHTDRNRKYTYIIKSEEGEYKQVGVKCSQEYICNNFFEWTAIWFRYLSSIEELESDDFLEEGIRSADPYYSVKYIIAYSIDAIDKVGYDKESGLTKEYILDSLKERRNIDPSCFTLADKIIDWVLTLDENNSDYIHNMQVYFRSEYLNYKSLPLVISVVPYYRGYLNRLESIKTSSYKYNVGDKVVVNVKDFRKVTTLNTIYGIMHIYKFTDEDRNVYIWKTGKVVSSDISSIKGTVKACSEYNGEKQTELTRCKTF